MDEHTHDLNRRIAQARGYTELELRTYWVEEPWSTYERVYLWGVAPGERGGDYLPDWAHDLNAAWNDLLPELLKAGLILEVSERLSNIGTHDYMGVNEIYAPPDWVKCERDASAQSIAQMICEAWLVWTRQRRAE